MKKILKKIVVSILIVESKLILKKYKPEIVAITGSVGKTSTKDAIYTVLSAFTYVRKSQKSFNSEIGIPLTILGCPNGWSDPILWLKTFIEGVALIIFPNKYPKMLVLEVGADRPGDIKNVVSWMHPHVSVITKLSDVPVHVEFFASADEVKKEKSNLASALKKDDLLVLNADDKDVVSFANLTSAAAITYGFGEGATVRATDYKVVYENREGIECPVGISYVVNFEEKTAEVKIGGTIGIQNVYSTLAGIAVGLKEGFTLEGIVKAINEHETPPGRMKILRGESNTTIIDDSYNSSPIAKKEALTALQSLQISGKKIAILGDMLELGAFSAAEHRLVGEKVAEVCDILLTVGPRSKNMREAAISKGMTEDRVRSFEDSRKAGEYAKTLIGAGDVILVKGSQGTLRMERAVEQIMLEKDKKEKLLVRQEPEWQKR